MRLLVTGSAGLIGTHITAIFRSRGDTVTEFDIKLRDTVGAPLDTRNLEQVQNAAAGCDGIIHLAAVSRVVRAENDPDLCQAINVGGTGNMCRVAASLPEKPFIIFASSREVYGQPDRLPAVEGSPLRPCNVYGRSKVEGERLVAELGRAGVNSAILRFSNVYGWTGDHPDRVIPAFARRAATGGSITVNGPDCLFDFTHVDDVAEAIVTAVDRMASGDRLPPIHLASGTGTTLGELAQLAADVSRKSLDIGVGPSRDFDVSRFVGDPGLARTMLGWTGGTTLATGFQRLVREFEEIEAAIA